MSLELYSFVDYFHPGPFDSTSLPSSLHLNNFQNHLLVITQGQSTTLGVVDTLSLVPEPPSLIGCGLACVLGLAIAWRRRTNSEAATA